MTDAAALHIGALRCSVEEVDARGAFARWRKKQRRVVVSSASHPSHRLRFAYEEMSALCDGPILIEADPHSTPQGDYFIVSPELVDARSAVGEAMAGMSFEKGTLILLEGLMLMAQLSPSESEQLCAWLQAVSNRE